MRRQEGAVSRQQLLAGGLTAKEIYGMVRATALVWHFRGVYVDGRSHPTSRTHLWAAQLAVGERAFFSHRTAAALLGLRPINVHEIEMTVTSGHTPSRRGLTVHRTAVPLAAGQLRSSDGLRHSSGTRMLFEEADRERREELERLIAECARRNMLHLDQINDLILRHPHLPSAARLAEALTRYQPMSQADKSRFERAFADWVATLAEIPPPRRNVHVGPWEFDFYWPEQRAVAETDGDPYHRTPFERERDHLKDAWCQAHGHLIIRITEFRFEHDRDGIRSDLSAILHRP